MARSPVVLLHGFSGTPRSFQPILPALAAEHELLAVTTAGHFGGAALPGGVEPSFEALADAVERDMDAAGIVTAHLVGNSLGGWLALELAARGRARSVVALAPAGGWEPDGPQVKRLKRLFMRNYRLLQAGRPLMASIAKRPRARALALREILARPENLTSDVAYELMRGAAGCTIYLPFIRAVAADGFPVALGPIGVPVRIAWGTADRVVPLSTCSQRFRRLVPDAEWVELPGLGHVPMFDDPELVARTVLEVTRRVDAQPQAESAVASA